MNYKKNIPSYVNRILSVIDDAGYEAFVVGGAVRDMVLELPVHDYDIAASSTPQETMAVLERSGIRVVADTGIKHGTVTALVEGNNIEITSFREDGGYSDLRHPDEVRYTGSIDIDVQRRDFTMNALYLDQNGDVCDMTGGLDDIAGRLIRCVGDPEIRFEEDALRILRALRFKALLGFSVEEHTLLAMKSRAHLLSAISPERIKTEFTGIITAPYASAVIRENTDILSVILPELMAAKGFDQRSRFHDLDVLEHTLKALDTIPVNEDGKRPEDLSYVALMHDLGKPEVFTVDEAGEGHMKGHQLAGMRIALRFAEEYRFSGKLKDTVVEMVRIHDDYVPRDRISVHRLMCRYSPDFLEKLFVFQRADILAHSKEGLGRLKKLEKIMKIRDELTAENACLSVKDLKINGDDLISAGIEEGPSTGEMLNKLLEAVIEEKVENSREELMRFVREIS